MPRPRLHDENLRRQLIKATTEVVAHQGEAFALRPLAESLNTSTTAIYSLFGSRAALVDAVVDNVATTFAEALERVHHEDPLLWILGIGAAYRNWVRQSPAMFRIAFHPDTSSPTVRAARARTQAPLMAAVGAAIDEGYLTGDPVEIAKTLFAGAHGFLALENVDEFGGETQYYRLLDHLVRGFCTPKGRERVDARHQIDMAAFVQQVAAVMPAEPSPDGQDPSPSA